MNTIGELFRTNPWLFYLLAVGAVACLRAAFRLVILAVRLVCVVIRRGGRILLLLAMLGIMPQHDADTAAAPVTAEAVQAAPVAQAAPELVTAVKTFIINKIK